MLSSGWIDTPTDAVEHVYRSTSRGAHSCTCHLSQWGVAAADALLRDVGPSAAWETRGNLAVSLSSLSLGLEPGKPTPLHPLIGTQHDYAQHCSLIAADIADFSRPDRDDEIQLHLRTSLYQIFGAAFRDIEIAWEGSHDLHREDRGDGMTIVFRPHIPTGLVISQLLDPLLAELRHHNKVSSPAAQIQLRLALHAGLVTRDANGFAGQAAIHVFRIIEAPLVKRELAVSGADLALIVSDYVYDNFIRDTHGPVNPDTYTHVKVNVKKTRTRAWYRLAGGPSLHQGRSANGQAGRAASRRNLRVSGITGG
jgi:hypothetical protein